MTDDEFLTSWLPIEERFRSLEERYRIERLRPDGFTMPEGEALLEVRSQLTATCRIYIAAQAEHRAVMRSLFNWSYLLSRLVWLLIRIDSGMSAENRRQQLREALAAASLENNKTDYRDLYYALADIWHAAIHLGLDPEVLFQEAAEWSSNKDDFDCGQGTMRDLLSGFSQSQFFKAEIANRSLAPAMNHE